VAIGEEGAQSSKTVAPEKRKTEVCRAGITQRACGALRGRGIGREKYYLDFTGKKGYRLRGKRGGGRRPKNARFAHPGGA